ncbi:basic membrane protein [Olsenella profusa F0195]|uniref:Basic membrane protein n=2 Tax=Olsenella profusa TaxID=138595 RepID=U2USY0_9ACTN|nr:BMP family ABC transporter substrate-binding protein [Olsenella profusa]ERL06217.1 basic membrane protein [Olsenella profusa F0195]
MHMMNRRTFIGSAAAAAALVGLAGCGGSSSDSGSDSSATSSSYKIEMVTDTGGVSDQSFNQSSWEGLQQLQQDKGWTVSYLESRQESDYKTNLDKAVDDGANLVWGIGFAMADAVESCAQTNPDVQFAIIDNGYDDPSANLTGVMFRAQEPSFLVGYIAARVSTSGKVGFVGGISSNIISQFEWGYKAGVAYANKKEGLNVQVTSQYAESFSDAAKGKSIAQKMLSNGCDVVFHAAGGCGTGVIEAAKEAGKYAIGVDRDQAYLAPDNVLTSALKLVNKAIIEVSEGLQSGEDKGGANVELGLKEDAVGIPEDHHLFSDEIYDKAISFEDLIKDGTITPPATEDDYNTFASTL